MLYGAVFQLNNARPHAVRHTTLAHQQQHPNSSLAVHLPRYKPNRAHLGQVGQLCLRQVNAPANLHESFQALQRKWVGIPVQMIYNLIQSSLRDAEQLLILEDD